MQRKYQELYAKYQSAKLTRSKSTELLRLFCQNHISHCKQLIFSLLADARILTQHNINLVHEHPRPDKLIDLLEILAYNRIVSDYKGTYYLHKEKFYVPITQAAFNYLIEHQKQNQVLLAFEAETFYCSTRIARSIAKQLPSYWKVLFEKNLTLASQLYVHGLNNNKIKKDQLMDYLDKNHEYIVALFNDLNSTAIIYTIEEYTYRYEAKFRVTLNHPNPISAEEWNKLIKDVHVKYAKYGVNSLMMLFNRKTPPFNNLSRHTAIKICQHIDKTRTMPLLHGIKMK